MRRETATIANFIVGRNMPTKAKTTVRKTTARLDKSGEDGHLGGGKIRLIGEKSDEIEDAVLAILEKTHRCSSRCYGRGCVNRIHFACSFGESESGNPVLLERAYFHSPTHSI